MKSTGRIIHPAEVAVRIEGLDYAEKLRVLESLLRQMRFNRETLDIIAEVVIGGAGIQLDAALRWCAVLPHSPASFYLTSKLCDHAGRGEMSRESWEKFFAATEERDPLLLIQYARVLAGLGRYGEAATVAREALCKRLPYSFYARSASLVAQLRQQAKPSLRSLRIAFIASSTTSLLVPIVQALCFRDGIDAEFYQGQYGAFRQEILDPTSAMYGFNPNIVVLMTHWRDLDLAGVTTDEKAVASQIVSEYVGLWQVIAQRLQCHVVHHSFDLPAEEPYGYLSFAMKGGRNRVIRLINAGLIDSAPETVSILDAEEVARQAGLNRWSDPFFWHTAKQHPAPEALPELAEAQVAHIRAVAGLRRKVLVCDLDNTLWGGIIGEDGLQRIQLGPGSAAGEAYAQLQRYIRELKEQGVLLAICSKNNPDDARLPFEQHPHSILKLDDFAAFVANWNDKVSNLRDIANQLSLGTDSFVFLDDDPLQRAWVRSQMPEVAIVEGGGSPFSMIRELDRARYFYTFRLSAEDRNRGELYRSASARQALQQSSGSLEDFLAQLQMEATCTPVSVENIARVTQLINKTNQFNLTTRRYSQAEVEKLVARPHGWTGVFQLTDRFGDQGIIGVMICFAGSKAATLEIDTWLMSCRVLSRQMEYFMLDRLVEHVRDTGIAEIVGVYRPSKKNSQVADLYPRFGFKEISSTPEETRYMLNVADAKVPTCTFIENATLKSAAVTG